SRHGRRKAEGRRRKALRFSLHASRCRGFTLLELTLVLFIIGLLVAMAGPPLTDLGSSRLDSSPPRPAPLVRHLNGEAALHNRPYRLNYDLDRGTYWVTTLFVSRETEEFRTDPSPLSRPTQLPSSITFADVQVPGVGRVSTGRVYTHFFPHGYTDP